MKNNFFIQKLFVASSILLVMAVVMNVQRMELLNDGGIPVDSQKILNLVAAKQVPFLQNVGQYQPEMKYYSHLQKGSFFVDQEGKLIYSFGTNTIQENFAGTKKLAPQPEDPAGASINYFVGKNPEWKRDIPNYKTINFGEVFKGVNVKIKAFGNNVEKIFTVSPQANPDAIKMNFDGIDRMTINREGQLEMGKNGTIMAMSQPIAYQEIDGKKQYVAVAYKTLDQHSYGFKIGTYQEDQPLIIDPVIAATYIGGSNGNDNYISKPAVAVNAQDKIFVVGTTSATDFPLSQTTGVYTTPKANGDIFVAKYNNTLTTLEAFTYLGGAGVEGQNGADITLDELGNVYVTGDTSSTDFPTTTNAYQTNSAGNNDVFLVQLDSNLSNLMGSTYIGGSGNDFVHGIAVDQYGFVYLGGQTFSQNFPTTSGSFQTTASNTTNTLGDSFITIVQVNRASNNATTLVGSTLLGGSEADVIHDLKIAANENVKNIFVTGQTNSTNTNVNFPTTSRSFGSISNDRNNAGDAFISVLKFNKTNSTISLEDSTFLGGSENDSGAALSVDSSNRIYVTGTTFSTFTTTNFPTTIGTYNQNSFTRTASSSSAPGTGDAFLTKVAWNNNNGIDLSASTFLGGTNYDAGTGILLDARENIYVTGVTGSTDFPITLNAINVRNTGFNDGFVAKFNSNLTGLTASTFFGGSGVESNLNIGLDINQNLVLIGSTGSRNFPVTSDTYQTSIPNSSFQDGFMAKITNDLTAGVSTTSKATTDQTNTASIGSIASGGTTMTNMVGPRIFTNIPDHTFFPDAAAGNTTFNNASGADSSDTLTVSDMQNDSSSGFEVQLSASGFQNADKSRAIGLENLYVVTTLPHAAGNILDESNGIEYVASCIGAKNVRAPLNAESLMNMATNNNGYGILNNYTSRGSNLGNGTTGKVVVIMSAPAAARRCSMLVNVSYALKLLDTIQEGIYSVTLTYTLL